MNPVARRKLWIFLTPAILLVLFYIFLKFLGSGYEEDHAAEGFRRIRKPIDLLSMVDPSRDALQGVWKRHGPELVSPSVVDGLLRIPFRPPQEYDLHAVVEWKRGPDGVGIGLASGSSQVLCAIDAYEHTLTGLALIDGLTADMNETTQIGREFVRGKLVDIKCFVRRRGVRITIDGRQVVQWQGDTSRWSLRPPWEVRDKEALFLCSLRGVYHFKKLILTPISGLGRRLP